MMTQQQLADIQFEHQQLTTGFVQALRLVAEWSLERSGVEEIGPSDVSCRLMDLRHELGSWDAVLDHGMELV